MTEPQLQWAPLAGLPPELVCGLVVEWGERARAQTTDERWRRESATIRAVSGALAAAGAGEVPVRRTSTMPAWLKDVVAGQLRTPRAVLVSAAQSIRALERLGLVRLDQDAAYALAMLHLSGEWVHPGDVAEDLLVQVERDETLLGRMVHLLSSDERERGVDPSDDRPFRGSWQQPLVAAVASDPRARRLTAAASLDGLAGEPSTDRTRWYVGLLDALALTSHELTTHQPALHRLLTSASPAVVGYAVRLLRQLDRARLLDDGATAAALSPAVAVRTRTTARQAVRLLADIGIRSPTADVVPAALAALGQADAEVQRRAALLLVTRGRDAIPAEYFAALEPSVQHELTTLLDGVVAPDRHRVHRRRARGRTPTPADLADVPAHVLGGLLVEHGEQARAKTYDERWEKESALYRSITAAVNAALDGQEPATATTRMPSWLGPALRRRLADTGFFTRRDFFVVRVIERAALVALEPDEQYVTAMVGGLASSWDLEDREVGRPERWFADDPELLERAFWRIFEVPGNGTVSLTQTDIYGSDTWQRAVVAMVEDGRTSRARVIDAALDTLNREWPGFRLKWFAHLLAALALTVPELAARQPALRRLLRSAEAAALTPALDWLTRLNEAGQLDDQATALDLQPVMTARTKTLALKGLALLRAIHTRTPEADVAATARAALAHPHADVQRAAAALLAHVGAQLTSAENDLDPVVRRELGLSVPSTGRVTTPVVAMEPTALHPVTRVDLLDRLAALMEAPDEPVELELVLDGLARTEDPQGLRPLQKRAAAILKRGPGDWHGGYWLPGQIARLVTVACGRPVEVERPRGPVLSFLVERLEEVEQVLAGRARPGRLLATPDDPSGWVNARGLVRRLAAKDGHRPADLLAALLRLDPEGRHEALASADLPGELGRALRHALGGDEATSADVQDADLWVAASRARVPLGGDPVLVGAGLSAAGQGRGLDFVVTVAKQQQTHNVPEPLTTLLDVHGLVMWDTESWATVTLLADGRRRARQESARQPTALPSPGPGDLDRVDGAWHGWAATVWPHDAEHFSEHALQPMLESAQWTGGSGDAEHVLRALGRHPGRLGPLAGSVLALGLSSARLEDRVMAADVFMALVSERMAAADLAGAMAAMVAASKANRWAESLGNAASGGAGPAVADVLTLLLPQLPSSHHGLHALLDLLHQEQLRLGGPVDDPDLRNWLAGLRGSSKSARSARALLAL